MVGFRSVRGCHDAGLPARAGGQAEGLDAGQYSGVEASGRAAGVSMPAPVETRGKRIKTNRNSHRTGDPFNARDAMDATDAQTPGRAIGTWRPFSGIDGLVFGKAKAKNSIDFQLKEFGVCVPFASFASFALNGSEDVDALALPGGGD